jgi:hypothetical protein
MNYFQRHGIDDWEKELVQDFSVAGTVVEKDFWIERVRAEQSQYLHDDAVVIVAVIVDWAMLIDWEVTRNANVDFLLEPWQRHIASIEFGFLENDSVMSVIPGLEMFLPLYFRFSVGQGQDFWLLY